MSMLDASRGEVTYLKNTSHTAYGVTLPVHFIGARRLGHWSTLANHEYMIKFLDFSSVGFVGAAKKQGAHYTAFKAQIVKGTRDSKTKFEVCTWLQGCPVFITKP
ncbi:hypothetical protein GP486_003006 [Trichoglossum hirsutum]|uniref:Uncharacterized protein n=1 Tax=Trichoglossum hirsutum TaxID=265104 RepID=A0A9P8RR70_9PEZI|nr:hypothetical protein GP486_003006 [Trichoglossum hirsutum]